MLSTPPRRRAALWAASVLVVTALGAVWTLMAAPSADATSSAEPEDPHATKVMFLGDSITGSPGCWRADVWVALTDAGHAIDMVGSRTADECGGVTNAAGERWDPDNIGISGITAVAMNDKLALDGVMAALEPDVVAVLIGTNDVRGGATADEVFAQYDLLLSQLRDHNPNVELVIGHMLPIGPDDCPGCQATVDAINARLDDWADAHSSSTSPIVVAHTTAGFDVLVDTDDQVHPNASGTVKVAAAMTDALTLAIENHEARSGSLPGWVFAVSLVPLLLTIAAVLVYYRRIRSALQD